jgi:2-haloacid dehalogenase
MAGPPPTLRAVLFDAYGTLFDVHSVAMLAEQLFPGQGDALSQRWRDRQIEYSRLVSMAGRYRPFWELTRAALRQAAAILSLPLDAAAEDRLMNQYRHLASFPENREVLLALRQRGIRTGILSNGDPPMLDIAVRSAGFTDLVDPVLSVDRVQRYKPDPATYALGPQLLGLPASQILFVSSNPWDAIGATWAGYTTLWIARGPAPLDPLGATPTRTGHSLRDVLSFFDGPAEAHRPSS